MLMCVHSNFFYIRFEKVHVVSSSHCSVEHFQPLSHSGGIVDTSVLILLCDCCFGHSKIPEGCLDVNHNHTVKEMKGAWEPTSFTVKE